MNNRIILITILFMIFSRLGLGDENSYVGNFNEYVNLPENPSGSSVDKNNDPSHETHHDTSEKSDNTDAKPALQGIPSHWKACAVNSDCTAGVADCESWEPLNKKYLNELSGNLDACSASIDPGFQPETVCVNKACQITEKTTDVSWEEWLGEMRKEREQFPEAKK